MWRREGAGREGRGRRRGGAGKGQWGGGGMKGRAAQLLAAFPGFLASEVSRIRKKERFN